MPLKKRTCPKCGGEIARWTSSNKTKDRVMPEIFYKCIRCPFKYRAAQARSR
jgi:DNA-directed RNA polymerase subunit M/transcription elongation factor TFIIS